MSNENEFMLDMLNKTNEAHDYALIALREGHMKLFYQYTSRLTAIIDVLRSMETRLKMREVHVVLHNAENMRNELINTVKGE